MNTLMKRILPVTALAATLLAGAAWAQGPHGDFDPRRMLAHMGERLELSDEQRDQIEAIYAEGAEAHRADRKRMGEIRAALSEQQSDFDAAQAQALADELGELTARTTFNQTSSRAQVYQLLTEEQRAEMAQMRQQFGERRSKYKGKRGQGEE